jgi:hypothetical protein
MTVPLHRATGGQWSWRPGGRPAQLVVSLMALAAPVVGAACGQGADAESARSGRGEAHAAADEGEHQPLTMEVGDPLAQADIAGLAAASESVVRGTVVAAEEGVTFGGEWLQFTAYIVEVDEALSGALSGAAGARVRVIVESQVDGHDVVVEGRPVPETGDEGLWFLKPIAPRFDYDGYVLTGQAGLLLFDGDEVVGGGPHESPVATEVERLGSPHAVVERLRSVVR